MIRRQNKTNYIFIILFGIIEVLVMIGAYGANHFTRTRMGMLRHVVHLNGMWEEKFSILTIKFLALFIIISFGILTYIHYRKKKNNAISNKIIILLNYIITIWTIYFLLFYNTERNRGYYILGMCFIVITILQNIVSNCYILIRSNQIF